MAEVNPDRLLSLVAIIDDEWTDGLCQNSEVMSNSRLGKDAAAKALHLLGKEHPAYALVFTCWGAHANTLKAEEAEDLRQKGISGVWDKEKPGLVSLIKAEKARREQTK